MTIILRMQFAFAVILLLGSWLLLRRQAGGGALRLAPFDAAPLVLGWLLLLSLVARPVMAAVAIAALAAGLALTDAVKRATLREPLVFADRAELLEVVRHPRLYLPFAGPVRVVAGALAAAGLVAALVWLEPPEPHPSPLLMVPLAAACVLLPTWTPLLSRLAGRYRRLRLTGDPTCDMRHTGFLACLIIQATLARAERAARRAAVPAFAPLPAGTPAHPPPAHPPPARPVVLVQLESFFDARRLGPLMPPDLLPGFDRLCADAVQAGRLAVPCWGANTVRSEFAVLTGIGQAALGLDRFNPYERFAQTPRRSPLRSLAWEMKRRGYRTICLHPFDKRFYARASVMPKLGFDEFRGLEAFTGAARSGPYVSDRAVGEAIAAILRTEGPAVFVFAMTMGNHGPWSEDGAHPPLPAWAGGLDGLPEAAGLRGFLAGLAESDAMLAPMMQAMPPGGVLAVYGDHQPSLPAAFAALGLADESTDYAIWQAGLAPVPALRDIAAEDLAERLLRHLSAARGPVDRAGDDLR